MRRWLAALAAAAVAATAIAAEDAVRIEQAWARATPGGATTGAAYLTIESREADRLVAVETPVAGRAELHSHAMESGVMKMRPVDGVAVGPGQPATLKPGGDHIMLVGLTEPLRAGQSFPLTLYFAKAGTMQVTVAVEAAGTGPTPAAGSGGMKMPAGR